MFAGIWLFSALCALPPILGWSRYDFNPGKAVCTLVWSRDVSYTFLVLVLGVLAPFVVMLVCYYKIIKKVA